MDGPFELLPLEMIVLIFAFVGAPPVFGKTFQQQVMPLRLVCRWFDCAARWAIENEYNGLMHIGCSFYSRYEATAFSCFVLTCEGVPFYGPGYPWIEPEFMTMRRYFPLLPYEDFRRVLQAEDRVADAEKALCARKEELACVKRVVLENTLRKNTAPPIKRKGGLLCNPLTGRWIKENGAVARRLREKRLMVTEES